jgi:hypothetical protein
MDLNILKKKIDGYRNGSGSIKNVPPELLLELRQAWETYGGGLNQFRAELGVKTGTLRKLLVESKKLNHVLASSSAMGLVPAGGSDEANSSSGSAETHSTGHRLELSFDQGNKVIRFPTVDLLVEFLRKAA